MWFSNRVPIVQYLKHFWIGAFEKVAVLLQVQRDFAVPRCVVPHVLADFARDVGFAQPVMRVTMQFVPAKKRNKGRKMDDNVRWRKERQQQGAMV